MHLALYISLTGLSLGIQGIELQVQIVLGGFAGIDGATDDFGLRRHQEAFVAGRPVLGFADQRAVARSIWRL